MGKPVTISLIVEANTLFNMTYPIQAEIDKKVKMNDDNLGCAPGGNIKDFQSAVFIDQNVKWDGKTKYPDELDAGYKVNIESIERKNGINFFETECLPGTGGKVTAKVKNDSKLDGEIYEYRINFSIHYPNVDSKNFMIDPKLSGNN